MLQHDMMSHATEVTGDLPGHLLPGILLAGWALTWMLKFRRAPDANAAPSIDSSQLAGVIKMVVAVVAIFAHIPGATWGAMARAMAWQHMAMFVPFLVAGAADMLARRGRIDPRLTYVVHAYVFANIVVLFMGHGNPAGIEATAHRLLTYVLSVAALAMLAEAVRPSLLVRWIRASAVLGAGLWFAALGWILYLSGWALADPVNEMLVHVAWAATMLVTVALTIAMCTTRVKSSV